MGGSWLENRGKPVSPFSWIHVYPNSKPNPSRHTPCPLVPKTIPAFLELYSRLRDRFYPFGCLDPLEEIGTAQIHCNPYGGPFRATLPPALQEVRCPCRLHSRCFTLENPRLRAREFSTCKEDRPLFVQFCANNPDVLLEAAQRVEPYCDYVDINLGCPQNFAQRGNYGAYLMSNLPLVKSLMERLAQNLAISVSCKIRIFPDLQDTINYTKMLEEAGCCLLAVHGHTIDQKDQKTSQLGRHKAIRKVISIPVLANGNIRHIDDVW